MPTRVIKYQLKRIENTDPTNSGFHKLNVPSG